MADMVLQIGDHVRLKPPTALHMGNRWVWADGYVHGEISKVNPYADGGVSIIVMLEGWKVATYQTRKRGPQIYQFHLQKSELKKVEVVESAA